MNEPIYAYMKLGTIAFMSYPDIMKGEGPMLETIKFYGHRMQLDKGRFGPRKGGGAA